MNRIAASLLALVFLVSGYQASAEIYTYTGQNYNVATAPYTTAMSITGTITTSGPIPPNSVSLDITGLITSWSLNDGVVTLNNGNATLNGNFVNAFPPTVTTDGAGNITAADIFAFSTPLAAAVNDTNDIILTWSLGDQGAQNAVCSAFAGTCTSYTTSGGTGSQPVVGTWEGQYSIGGTITGLTASGLVLQNNGGDDLVPGGGTFTFATLVANSSAYAVTVLTQPTGQTCTVTAGSGAVAGANVTSVAVDCVDDGAVIPPPVTAPPAPVPTMSTYGLVLTMLGLFLVASRRLRGAVSRR